MKISTLVILSLLTIGLTPVLGQQPAGPDVDTPLKQPPKAAPSAPSLTKFNLDFPGGTPGQLVAVIEKAMGKPLNVIIPDEHANMKLPPLKMSKVDVSQLSDALIATSRRTETYLTPYSHPGMQYGSAGMQPSYTYNSMQTGYGFRTTEAQSKVSDDSIWHFYVDKPGRLPTPPLAKVCRYYSLARYLQDGQTVDDITTAIKTGWELLGEKDTPTISFHKDTKLLIAVGDPGKLETIDAVLKALEPPKAASIDPTTGLPLQTDKPKAKK